MTFFFLGGGGSSSKQNRDNSCHKNNAPINVRECMYNMPQNHTCANKLMCIVR